MLCASALAPSLRSCSAACALAPQRRPCSVATPVPCRKRAAAHLLRRGAFALSAPLLCHGAPVSSPLCRRFPCQQQLRQGGASYQAIRHGAPASSKPHLAEKSTAVWLAIWRIWAGFANSQLWRATFRSTYLYMCPSAFLPNMTAARTEQISRPICTDCLRHLRISA